MSARFGLRNFIGNFSTNMSSQPSITLNTGYSIPAIGLGTWQSKPGEVEKAVEHAIRAGYRHIDAAFAYKNEEQVGQGIRASGVPRSELFITSKLWGTWHRKAAEALDKTLEALGTDYLDLYLMHWPIPLNPNGTDPFFPLRPDGTRDIDTEWDIAETWKQLEVLQKSGKVRSIGVSNASEVVLDKLLANAEIIPAANQIELHLYNPQHKLIAYLKKKGIVPQAYSPLGSTNSPLLTDTTVVEIAKKYSLDPSAVLLGYLLAKGIVALPKSVTASRIESNFNGAIEASTKLIDKDIQVLDEVATGGKQKRFIRPPWGVPLGFEDWNE